MKSYGLPTITARLWQLRTVALGIVLLAITSVLALFTRAVFIAFCCFLSIIVVLSLIFIPFHINSYNITCYTDSIVIKRGFIIKTSYILPYTRMIYAETLVTPLARRLGLSAVFLKAARGWIFIPEMKAADLSVLLGKISGEKQNENKT